MFQAKTYTSFDGLALHVRDYAGPAAPRLTVLCLPGLTRNARDFEALAEHLSARYRVLCADLRGRGRSAYAADPMTYVPAVYLRDVAALLDAMGAPSVALVGTSLGGIIGMTMAAVMPHRLLGVVLNDVGPEFDAAGIARIGRMVGKPAVFASWEEVAAALKTAEHAIYPDYQDADWVRLARCRFIEGADGKLRPDYDLAIAKPFTVDFAPVDLWPFFASLKSIPTLAIRGGTSDLLSAQVFARMKEVVPRLEQVTVPNRGHVPMLDEPLARDALDRFLARLPRRLGPLSRLVRKTRGAMFAAQLMRNTPKPTGQSSR